MNQPSRYLRRMTVFVATVAVIAGALIAPLKDAFLANAALNGVIAGTLFLGIALVFRQVLKLKPEIAWVEQYRARTAGQMAPEQDPVAAEDLRLLGPMAAMLEDRTSGAKLSALSTRSLLDSIGSRLDEGREMSRYMIGLLIFLGLLGTFWGLLGTIGAISGTISSLTVESTELASMFADLKAGLEAPLSGMATAFSSSLFGLAGSVILGFLDLQAGQAQNAFYNDLEEWLSKQTRLSGAVAIEGASNAGGSGSGAFMGALLEQTSDSLDKIGRLIAKSEEGRKKTSDAILALAEQQAALSDQLRSNQEVMAKLAEGQLAMSAAFERLSDAQSASNSAAARPAPMMDDATKSHLRNMDVHLKNLLDAQADGREAMMEDLRSEIKLLARTIAAAIDASNQKQA